MAKKPLSEEVEKIVKLSDKESKFALLKLTDPNLSDNKVAELCNYSGHNCGTQVRTRVAGKIGGLLAGYGLGLETIAENIKTMIGARKTRPVFYNQFNSKGRQTGVKMEVEDLGPDYSSIDRATKLLILLQKIGEKEEAAQPQIPEQTPTPQMSAEELQAAVGRKGPTEVIEAEFETVEEPDVASG